MVLLLLLLLFSILKYLGSETSDWWQVYHFWNFYFVSTTHYPINLKPTKQTNNVFNMEIIQYIWEGLYNF